MFHCNKKIITTDNDVSLQLRFSIRDIWNGFSLLQDGICHAKNNTGLVKIKGYVNVTSGDLDALKIAIAKQGPISVGIDASHKSLSFYSNGVYYEPNCGKSVRKDIPFYEKARISFFVIWQRDLNCFYSCHQCIEFRIG